ncbi:MAG TPA: hypothetical protein VMD09_07500 [Solirubrobacteraceae bacterium]|nr:hypothetical protein [Solirubrobacteraceae bacterium]
MADEPQEALRRLEERLNQASDAAERLLAEAARSARGGAAADAGDPPRGDHPPPSGWQMPRGDEQAHVRGPAAEFEALVTALGLVRDLVPPEVLARLATAVRELLMALRALIDYYLERLDRPRPEPERVRDIPID